ncbi:MAG: hypothetical protein AB7O62_12465 [Pirellulales bacterium]
MRRKLLAITAVVVVVAVAIKFAVDFDIWNAPDGPALPRGPADTVLRQAQPAERIDGEFRAVAEPAAQPATTRKFFPGVREKYLTEVRDDDFFRPREGNAFFHLLQVLAEADPAAIEKASVGEVSFAQLHEQPAAFRGEIVTLRGRLRQLQRIAAVPNEFGVDDYYQATIQPDDNPTFPVLVYVRRLPPGFPSQLQLAKAGQPATIEAYNDDVTLAGFFFKRLAYRAKDDVRTAPLILADSFQWQSGPAPGSVEVAATHTFVVMALVITLGLLLAVLIVARGRGTLAAWINSPRAVPAEGQLTELNRAELLASPSEHLKQLEQQSREGPPS